MENKIEKCPICHAELHSINITRLSNLEVCRDCGARLRGIVDDFCRWLIDDANLEYYHIQSKGWEDYVRLTRSDLNFCLLKEDQES